MADRVEDGGRAPSAVTQRRIEWSDTDGSGHYHYATALRLFEASESELLERLGMLADVYGRLPRVHVSCDYHRILWFRDLVDVAVRVVRVGRTSVEYSLDVRKDGESCVTGRVVAVLCDESGRPVPWSPQQRTAWRSYAGTGA